eukprot:scaffold3138_cov54-Isochrysis_galbana.AAC.1
MPPSSLPRRSSRYSISGLKVDVSGARSQCSDALSPRAHQKRTQTSYDPAPTTKLWPGPCSKKPWPGPYNKTLARPLQ